ncbi:hypothetical protein QOZ80_6AG0528470 [Eleusine coracana subsp. coracana]|nr:hypothetical protein QOZ80_6AG0528470 [Eleusine coracana subsp. coracana]
MAGFPLGGGGGGHHHHHHHTRDDPSPSVPPSVHPSDAASFLYAARAGGAGLQLWQQNEHPFYASNIIRFSSDDPATGGSVPSLTGGAASSSSSGRGTRAGGGGAVGIGGVSCQDCGNQAKKDCAHQRCRTCCKCRGFSCPTHVKSTWVPAAKRRERQQQLAVLAASAAATTAGGAGAGPSSSRDVTKRPRARLSVATPTTSSGDQQLVTVAERFPREVSSEAVFRCVRLGPVDQAEAEVAYQTTVSIGGHVFKGLLHDVGPHCLASAGGGGAPIEYHHFRHAGDQSPPTTAAGEAGGGNVIVSSAVVMDPYPTPGPYGVFTAGAPFFHGHPRQ